MHCLKSVDIRGYSGPHFPAFGLNTDRYGGTLDDVMQWCKSEICKHLLKELIVRISCETLVSALLNP